MAQLRKDHPWNPHYAIPQNVEDEPFGQGVVVSKGLPRRSISAYRADDAQGYVIPRNVAIEPPGRGVVTSPWAPRGTISAKQPDWFTEGKVLEVAAKMDLTNLGSLGSDDGGGAAVRFGSATDPIANFGREGAKRVLEVLRGVPQANKQKVLKGIFDRIDPSLWESVAARAEKLQKEKGLAPDVSLERALAAALANNLVDQFLKAGQAGKTPLNGLLGLARPERREALGFSFGGALSSFGGKIAGLGGKVVNSLGSLACSVASNPNTAAAASQIPSPQAQTIAIGAGVAASLCGGQQAGQQPVLYPPPAAPFPIVPVVVVGGMALVAVALIVRK